MTQDKKREGTKERVRRYRSKQKALQGQGVTSKSVTEGVEMVPAAYIIGNKGSYQFLPERPRFPTLSDGQVLDRLNRPKPNRVIPGMRACNDAYFFVSEGQHEGKERYAVTKNGNPVCS